MIIVLTSSKGKVYEVIDSDDLVELYNKWDWLKNHLEDLGYMMIKEESDICEFANSKGWRYAIMLGERFEGRLTQEK